MKKKFKVTLAVFLVVILGCFSETFAATKVGTKLKRNVQVSMNKNLLDSVTTDNTEKIDQYTKLLMHMDDDAFKDELGHAVTNTGVTLDTTNKKFGEGSASFNGTNNYLNIDNSDFNFVNEDFTIDCWVNLKSYSNDNSSSPLTICGQHSANSYNGYYLSIKNGYLNFVASTSGSSYEIKLNDSNKIDLNTFTHIAIVRKNNNFYLFKGGILVSTKNISGAIKYTTSKFFIGNLESGNDYFNGNIDEFRVSKGIARWTSKFTPPPVPYSNILATGISLSKTTDSLTVGQTDPLTATVTPDNAANKTVKWTSSDENIVKVDQNGNITAVGKGTATITATTTDGTNLSDSCTVTVTDSVTPTPTPTDNSDKAVLNITMANGQVKQYNVTMDTVNKFISWYKLRSAGSGDPFYEFDITQNSNPNIIKTDYVIFDKISSFEVDDYTK